MATKRKSLKSKLARWKKLRARIEAMKIPDWHKHGLKDQGYMKIFMNDNEKRLIGPDGSQTYYQKNRKKKITYPIT